ncbi:MAG: hypothetical protein ACKVS6_06690 [Planctomycetota bacterium]
MSARSFFLYFAIISFLALSQDSKPADSNNKNPAPQSRAAGSDLLVEIPVFPNVTCPIMGKPISTKLFVNTVYGKIYICCKSCTKKILADVDTAYMAAYPVAKKIDNKKCPITGNAISKDAKGVKLQGHEFSVCTDSCVETAKSEPQVTLVKITNSRAVDLNNTVCPQTSLAVEKDVFCMIGDSIVRLSSPECVDAVKKNPSEALKKAKAAPSRK